MLPIVLAALQQAPIDNDVVRVVNAANVAGQKSGLHKHVHNRVMIHLDAGHMRLAYRDGSAPPPTASSKSS